MSTLCPYCQNPLSAHSDSCRVPPELDRFERVHARLSNAEDKTILCRSLARHLAHYQRWAGLDGGLNSATSGAW
jgi:hypothetical protein